MSGSPESYTLATFSSRLGVIVSLVLLAAAFAGLDAAFGVPDAPVFAIGVILALVPIPFLAFKRISPMGGLRFRLLVGLPIYGTLIAGALVAPEVGDMIILAVLGVLFLGFYVFYCRDGSVSMDVRRVLIERFLRRRSISLDAVAEVRRHRGIIAWVARRFGFTSTTVTLKLHAWSRGRLRFLGRKTIHLNVAAEQVDDFLLEAENLIQIEEEEEDYELPALGQSASG